MRIGVFDSRSVALAYYNSTEHQQYMRSLLSELQAAKAAGNQAKVAELEFQGPSLQNLMHYQVFSTASIPNVLERLRDVLPRVAQQSNVSLIVSKWEVAFRRDDVEYIDVTDALIQPFAPAEKVQRWIADGKAKDPVPLLQLVLTLRPER